MQALLKYIVTAKTNSLENLLDLFCISATVTFGVAKSEFLHRIIDHLSHSKAVVLLNLLYLAYCLQHRS